LLSFVAPEQAAQQSALVGVKSDSVIGVFITYNSISQAIGITAANGR